MIESIEIKNFRCFKDTKIAKFGLVNLFGGLNNSGKTTLLEAIRLMFASSPYCIRKEQAAFIREMPQNAWDNWFFQQNKEKEIFLSAITENSDKYDVILNCDEKEEVLINIFNDEVEEINQDDLEEKELIKSKLNFCVYKNSEKEHSVTLTASKSGVTEERLSTKKNKSFYTYFISASAVSSTSNLAKEYDKARFADKEHILLDGLKIVDNEIEKIDIFTIGNPNLYLQKKNERRLPITMFGDAINKIANFILSIINNSSSIILIDEIENGIHYTNQEKLWEMLFKLAIEYNVQIFSTSHSLEMIKAFANVAKQFPEKAAYFEMARHYKTGNIIGTSIPIDILEYDIENNFRFRGE